MTFQTFISVRFIGGPNDGDETLFIHGGDSKDLREIFRSLDISGSPEGEYVPVSANLFRWQKKTQSEGKGIPPL